MRFVGSTQGFARCHLLLVTWVMILSGCSQSEISSLDSDSAKGLDAAMAEFDGESISVITVPEGTPEELFAFLEGLDNELQLATAAQDANVPALPAAERAIVIRQVMEARVAACQKILANEIGDETRQKAIRIQLDALRTLVAMDPEGMSASFDEFTDQLIADSDPVLGRIAKAARFQVAVNQGLSQADLSAEAVLSQLKDLLSDPEAGAETFVPTREAASWLLQYGQIKTATRALRNIGQHFQKHPNPDVAREAKTLIDESYKLDLTQLARQVADDQSGATQELLNQIEELLSADPNDADALGFALQTAQLLEFSGHFDDALNIYRGIGRIYQNSSASGLARDVQRSVALAERRLSLVGQSLDIKGTRINGGAFDWGKYRGRWVIVGFWTTWHPGWLDELNNIRSAVSTYPDAEIEVIEICLDDDRNLVERFLKEHPTSWPVLVNSDATALGFENPNAVACGVEAVPFVLLIDPNGKVADIHLMGDRLSAALAAQLDK